MQPGGCSSSKAAQGGVVGFEQIVMPRAAVDLRDGHGRDGDGGKIRLGFSIYIYFNEMQLLTVFLL
jgi:hypothetical protein